MLKQNKSWIKRFLMGWLFVVILFLGSMVIAHNYTEVDENGGCDLTSICSSGDSRWLRQYWKTWKHVGDGHELVNYKSVYASWCNCALQ